MLCHFHIFFEIAPNLVILEFVAYFAEKVPAEKQRNVKQRQDDSKSAAPTHKPHSVDDHYRIDQSKPLHFYRYKKEKQQLMIRTEYSHCQKK